jgi:hypothetical protein
MLNRLSLSVMALFRYRMIAKLVFAQYSLR